MQNKEDDDGTTKAVDERMTMKVSFRAKVAGKTESGGKEMRMKRRKNESSATPEV